MVELWRVCLKSILRSFIQQNTVATLHQTELMHKSNIFYYLDSSLVSQTYITFLLKKKCTLIKRSLTKITTYNIRKQYMS